MTYRFEEEDYRSTYVLEDFYCTNPFCDCNHVTISLMDQDNHENHMTFLFNFNKTSGPLPNQPKMTTVQDEIIRGFAKNAPDELLVLFKQRYLEAKAYGENNPFSYLLFEPGRYMNYYEMFPRNDKTLDFSYGEDKFFAEDSYEVDPRVDNKDVKLTFYKLALDNEKKSPLISYTYFFDEKSRESEDSKLSPENNDMVMALNQFIPDLFDTLKERYRETKKIGDELIKAAPQKQWEGEKVKPNDPCPCGSGKKFKKCCALKIN